MEEKILANEEEKSSSARADLCLKEDPDKKMKHDGPG